MTDTGSMADSDSMVAQWGLGCNDVQRLKRYQAVHCTMSRGVYDNSQQSLVFARHLTYRAINALLSCWCMKLL